MTDQIQELRGMFVKAFLDQTGKTLSDDDLIIDGLHYCSKCKTPKERITDYEDYGGVQRYAVNCKCKQEEIDWQKEQEAKRKLDVWKQNQRRYNLRSQEWIESRFESDEVGGKASAIFKKYAEDFDKYKKENIGILIFGGVGTGKTFYAACIANALIEQQKTVYMIDAGDLMSRSMKFEEDIELHKKLDRSELVVLDDLGAERDTSFGLEQMYNFINRRYRSGKPLIVTTNISAKEMQGESRIEYRRIYDRITQMCPVVMPLAGQSKRQSIADKKFKLAQELMEGSKND